MSPLFQSWLLESFLIFLVLGSLAGMVVGSLLIVRPQSLQRFSKLMNRWISTRHLDESLERTVTLDPWFYRYRFISGVTTLLGALYILYFFTVSIDRAEALIGLSRHYQMPVALAGALLDALALSALLGALFAVFVCLFLLLRPSMLRDFEQNANQWLSLRRALRPVEIPRTGLDEFFYSHSRQAGVVVLLGSIYTMVFLLSRFSH